MIVSNVNLFKFVQYKPD